MRKKSSFKNFINACADFDLEDDLSLILRPGESFNFRHPFFDGFQPDIYKVVGYWIDIARRDAGYSVSEVRDGEIVKGSSLGGFEHRRGLLVDRARLTQESLSARELEELLAEIKTANALAAAPSRPRSLRL